MERINPENPKINKRKKINFWSNFFKALLFSILIIAVALLLSYQFKDTEPIPYNQIEDDANVESSINSYMEGDNLIIEYTNPNNEKVWIKGLDNERYLIDEKEIIIYDYQQSERFELHIGEDSDVFEFGTLSVTDRGYIEDLRNSDSIETKDGITKEYISNEKRIIIEDGERTILNLQLESDYEVVAISKQNALIAWFKLEDFSGIDLADNIKFYDVNDNYKELDKDYVFKYKIENYLPIFDQEGVSISNKWVEFNDLSELPSKNIEIGLFTDISFGDKIEWVIEKEGFEVLEWALVIGTSSGFVEIAPTGDPDPQFGNSIDDFSRATHDTSPSDAIKIVEIGWWNDGSNEVGNYEIGLYSDESNNEPEILLQVNTENANGVIPAWERVLVDWEISADTTYWLAVQFDQMPGFASIGESSSGGTGSASKSSQSSLPANWGSSTSTDADGISAIYAIYEIDNPPTFTTIPDNQSILYLNESLNVTFVGTDETEFDSYAVNDTDNFQMGFDSGFLINNTPLGAGNYDVNVTINDTVNNINWTIFTLEVSQSSNSCSVLFNETSPQVNDTAFRVYSYCSSGFQLYRNGSVVGNNSQQYPLSAGIYNYSVFRNDTINYSNIFDDEWFTLTPKCYESLVNTSWSSWNNISCLSGDLMNQSRTKTTYDENVCGASNITYYEYRQTEFCDFCTPSLDYYYGDWANIDCPHSEIWNQSRETTYYDTNFCGEVANVTSFEYRNYGVCEYTGAFVPSYFGVPSKNQTRDLLGIFTFVNQETNNLFFPIMLVVLFMIQMIGAMASGSSGAKAWVGAGFICSVLSIPLGILAFVSQKYIYLLILMTALGAFWLKLSSSKE